MRLKLEVRGDTVSDILTGMAQMRKLIIHEVKRQRGRDAKGYEVDHVKPFELIDDNCYGEAVAKVSNTR